MDHKGNEDILKGSKIESILTAGDDDAGGLYFVQNHIHFPMTHLHTHMGTCMRIHIALW
jgi:hypothetical protein